ncbi:hypothetical protein BIW11_02948 [Tropilaelaps mercedesae]|uniref:Uncharacterized protein n=1 Tax=Tropilaelaps mercedesae TaxID=418985 RepID=A0A1V9XUJ6_9ACAR|nr:hypothetical protein BIW11_02948 [Tropilaelaps mercedesae]
MSLPSSHIVVSSSGPIFSAVSTFPQATVVSSNPTMMQVPVTAQHQSLLDVQFKPLSVVPLIMLL